MHVYFNNSVVSYSEGRLNTCIYACCQKTLVVSCVFTVGGISLCKIPIAFVQIFNML